MLHSNPYIMLLLISSPIRVTESDSKGRTVSMLPATENRPSEVRPPQSAASLGSVPVRPLPATENRPSEAHRLLPRP